jgi:flagellar biosynthesis protein FlhA
MSKLTVPAGWIALARSHGPDLVLPLTLIGAVAALLVPLPSVLMDVLLSANLAVSVVMLLAAIHVRTPLELSTFPTLLLATTLTRLVLNVATTRLILTRGDETGLSAAGEVVRRFGEFVGGDQVVVGMVVFAIIVTVQFVVITKGATRISEVAARFALDAMPGKQSAIDADLHAGLIDERTARERRKDLNRHADFFAAMDGASKFVRGDAVAGLVIMVVNIAGGLFVGVVQGRMNVLDAADLYTRLTIGDGLVSQVPAFLISLAAGLLITRSSEEVNLSRESLVQLLLRPHTLAVTAGFLGVLVLMGMPAIPLCAIGAACGGLAWHLVRSRTTQSAAQKPAQPSTVIPPADSPWEGMVSADPIEIEVGVDLVRLASSSRGGDLVERIQHVRRELALSLGVVLPNVRIRDNLSLGPKSYRIKLFGTVLAEGALELKRLLALDLPEGRRPAGSHGLDPNTGRSAVWIDPSQREQVLVAGGRVLDASAVLTGHLLAVGRRHADELLSREAVRQLVDRVGAESPSLVNDLIPERLRLGEVHRVLRRLVAEGIPIRQLTQILEALAESCDDRDPVVLTEHVRIRMARTISALFRDSDRSLSVVQPDDALAEQLSRLGLQDAASRTLSHHDGRAIAHALCEALRRMADAGHRPVLLVESDCRAAVRDLVRPVLPDAVVLGMAEVTADTVVRVVERIAARDAAMARVAVA